MEQLPPNSRGAPSQALMPVNGGLDPAVPAIGPAMGPDARFVTRVLLGRKWLVLGLATTLTVLAAVGISQLRDRYTATALLLVDDRPVRIVREADQVMGAIPAEDQAILSEIEILKSPHVLGRVIEDLGLQHDEEFNPDDAAAALNPDGLAATATRLGRSAAEWLWGATPPEAVSRLLAPAPASPAGAAGADPVAAVARTIERVQRQFDVAVVGRSRVIEVRFTSRDPRRAAAMVENLVRRYMETRQQMDREVSTGAVAWLKDRIAMLRGEVVATEQAAESYRQHAGLIKGQTGPLAVNDMEQTRTRLTEAAANRARLVAQAAALERNLRAGDWNAVGGSIASPVIAQLRASIAQHAAELAQLSQQYGPRHPKIVELKARLGDAEGSVQQEIRREVAGVREAATVAIEQERALAGMIAQLESNYASLSQGGIHLRTLELESNAKRQLLESLMGRLEEVQAQQDNRAFPTGVKLVSPPQIPEKPSQPNRPLLIAAAVVASGAISVGCVFGIELARRRVRTPESLRRALGVARVHLVPHHPLKNRHAQLYEVIQRNPFSLFSESMRALYRNQVAGLGPVGAVAVTSARPHDGKTSLSLALAQAASQAGRRVVVVDTDFRQARIDKLFDLVGRPGLADWIAGEATLDTIVYHAPDTDAVPFALVPAGRLTSAALDRFNVDALVELMAGLSPHYDLIVLDTPPLLALSDARVACAAASRVLFVARWGHTTDRDLEAVADIAPIDHTRFACVMTDVDLRKAASSGFHDAYRNYRASQHYYDEQGGLGTGLGTAR